MTATTLPGLLSDLLVRDGARPLVTFYDDAAGERVELSVASFENAVAKTANLLQDELGTEPGERVLLLLPTHWQSAVWVFAAASCGLQLADPDAAGDPGPEVVVCGPGTLERAAGAGARDVVALALRPLGGPFAEPLPDGVLDHGVEAQAQPDVFNAYEPVEADRVLLPGGRTQQQALAAGEREADALGLPAGGRLLTDLSPAVPDQLVAGLLPALVRGGSVVLVRHPAPDQSGHAEQERVDRTRLHRPEPGSR